MRLGSTYATLASTLALVVALGTGGAYAAGLAKNSVGSAQLKPGAVKAADLAKNSVTGKSVKKDALTGKDIKESTLGTVPSAARVDTVLRLSASSGQSASAPLGSRGYLSLTLDCGGAAGTASASLSLRTSRDHGRWVSNNGVDTDFNVADGPATVTAANTSKQDVSVSAVGADGQGFTVIGWTSASGGTCWADVAVID